MKQPCSNSFENIRPMQQQNTIQLFEEKKVRSIWDESQEKWYISIVDVIAILTDSPKPNNYWKVLKHRLVKEGSQLVTNCNQLKMQSPDGKFYKTDVADTEQIFRLVQSIPSPKAEPFKLWLAKVGNYWMIPYRKKALRKTMIGIKILLVCGC
jgi:ABC-type Fe3+ transport system substrate-binding protein